MSLRGFDSTVAARTRTAKEILDNEELLDKFIEVGGSKDDLEAIAGYGTLAEALNLAQGTAQSAGGGATQSLLTAFAALQHEYSKVMGIVQSVQRDLTKAGASDAVLAEVKRILVNEAALSVRTTTAADGKKSRSARPSSSQEDIRAEIARDAGALIALAPVHAALDKKTVSLDRLKKLKKDADGLSGNLADRTVKKGAAKGVTKAEREAVKAQSGEWVAHRRVLEDAGAADVRIQSLLDSAAR